MSDVSYLIKNTIGECFSVWNAIKKETLLFVTAVIQVAQKRVFAANA